MPQITSIRIFPTPAIAPALQEALDVLEQLEYPDHLEEAIFNAAVHLIGMATTIVEQPQAVPLPSGLLNHKGR